MTAREIALQVVRDVFVPAGSAPERGAQESLDYRLRSGNLDARDRSFVTHLAFGAIKMRRAVDWYLAPYVGGREKRLPPVIAEILRLGTSEIRFTSSQPHAIVSEWVNLAKRHGHRGTAGLVNAVLRSMLRDKPPPPTREEFESEDDYLGTVFSYPTWIVRQFRDTFGTSRLEAILEACNAPAQAALAVNGLKATRDDAIARIETSGASAKASELAADCVLVSDGAAARRLEREDPGCYWMQSESSCAVVDVLAPGPGEELCDACSGRGSKALQMAARLRGEGALICVDRDARKLQALERRAALAGVAIASVTGDATAPIFPKERRFDRILIDAPCSGIGVIGRHPEARWRKRPDDGERLALTQRALLEALAPHVFEGGTILYAVCSTDPRETAGVAGQFARANGVRRGLIPAQFSPFETEEGYVLIPPGLGGRDGFFIARFDR